MSNPDGAHFPVKRDFSMAQYTRDSDFSSFEAAYGLGLIATNPPGVNPSEIRQHLGPHARRIATAIVRRKSASGGSRSSSKRSMKVARKK